MSYTKEDLKPIPQSELTGIPLLREIVERIKADERAWNQGDWIGLSRELRNLEDNEEAGDWLDDSVRAFLVEHQAPPWNCGTAYCVAGHVALAKGAKLPSYSVDYAVRTGQLSATDIIRPDGRTDGVSSYASAMLGLNSDQAITLFAGSNSLEEIDRMVTALEADANADLWDIREDVRQGYLNIEDDIFLND